MDGLLQDELSIEYKKLELVLEGRT